jgi:hypothetical protein
MGYKEAFDSIRRSTVFFFVFSLLLQKQQNRNEIFLFKNGI